ncbi:hypothetical protein [Thermococcus sp. MV11]|uniref:hypothetical protein n=1 Tax=Thermococcus sp. MV11 TaxID=1638267 RepID=UPI00142F7B31|nr:hypothetical protein [Thermococcus sp. MV11]NJE02556.1 hypothetical protein [Thermococcus sp. MV11]
MEEIKVRVSVPEGLEGIFEKELEALVKGLRRLVEKPSVTVDDVFGIMPTEKSAREMRLEAYEELFG